MTQSMTPIPDWPGGDRSAPTTIPESSLAALEQEDARADLLGAWSESLWSLVVQAGGARWSLPVDLGGSGSSRGELLRDYARLAEASLTAAFVLTQYDAAVRRLIPSAGGAGRRWLEALARDGKFATVGISQLTTSRRHGARAMAAQPGPGGGFLLDGVMPWVTAAVRADAFVTGGVLDDGRQLLVVVPRDRPGLTVSEPMPLAALQASCTCEVRCEGVSVEPEEILAGPSHDVMAIPGLAGTGGLETSALALGQARAALRALAGEGSMRDDLDEPVEALASAWVELARELVRAADGEPGALAPGLIRSRSNAFVLRATQAYLAARKGTGFLRSEPAQRWARQALFFLVWSCPTPVAQASIRDLAGLCSA